jgi:hypothetical protein
MKKRFGIAILVLGICSLLAYWISRPATPPPAPTPPPPPAEAPLPVVAPVSNAPVVVPPDTNPPAAPVPPPPVETNPPPVVVPPPDTNPPPAAPVVVAPETNPPATVIASAGPPVNGVHCSMVRNLLTDSFTNNLTDNQDLFYRFRAGYERGSFGNVKNTWYLGAKLYYRPQAWRDELKDNTNRIAALLIPDIFSTVEHASIETVDDSGNPVALDGVRVGVGMFWPWLNWHSKAPDNCPDGDLKLSAGPTVNGGVEENTTGSDPDLNWFGYGGVRLAFSPDAFVEYTVGTKEEIRGFHQQVVGELPIYRKGRSDFRYVVRGLWNTSVAQPRDIYEVAIMVEFPFEALEHPSNFRDLIPFIK